MRDVLRLTRKMIVLLMEQISRQNHSDVEFEAKLHGFKMQSGIQETTWEPEEDDRMTEMARKSYEKMQAEAAQKRTEQFEAQANEP